MKRKALPLSEHCITLYRGDFKRLEVAFGRRRSAIIRDIVHELLNRIDEGDAQVDLQINLRE